MAYFPVMIFASLFFVIANLLMIPFAYFKTIGHKYALYKKSVNSSSIYRNRLITYIIMGIPLLLVS